MAGTLVPWLRQQFLDNSGNVLASGTVETYEAGTSTALATYSDSALGVANPTTLSLNSAGVPSVSDTEVAMFLLPRAYKFIIKNSAGTTIATRDNITALQSAGAGNLDITGTAGEALAANDLCYLSDGSGSLTAGRWYKADADAYYASIHPALAFATAAIASGSSGTLRIGGIMDGLSGLSAGSTYYVSGTAGQITATAPTNARSLGMAISATSLAMDIGPAWVNQGDPLSICDGRLTLTTATPVTTADVTAAGTLYFTPYKGNRVALFDGNKWKTYAFAEVSLALSISSGSNYDVWLYDNAGTLTLETLVWTNDTTRATALALQNGVYVKTGATTRRYLGTIRGSGANTTEDSLTKRYVWNYYNRVPRVLRRLEATGTWTYTTATVRQANGAAANQVDIVVGVAEARLQLRLQAGSTNTNADILRSVGIGEDSTTTFMAAELNTGMNSGAGAIAISTLINHVIALTHYPAIGRHFYAWNEISGATGTTTWYGTTAPTNGTNANQSGLSGEIDG